MKYMGIKLRNITLIGGVRCVPWALLSLCLLILGSQIAFAENPDSYSLSLVEAPSAALFNSKMSAFSLKLRLKNLSDDSGSTDTLILGMRAIEVGQSSRENCSPIEGYRRTAWVQGDERPAVGEEVIVEISLGANDIWFWENKGAEWEASLGLGTSNASQIEFVLTNTCDPSKDPTATRLSTDRPFELSPLELVSTRISKREVDEPITVTYKTRYCNLGFSEKIASLQLLPVGIPDSLVIEEDDGFVGLHTAVKPLGCELTQFTEEFRYDQLPFGINEAVFRLEEAEDSGVAPEYVYEFEVNKYPGHTGTHFDVRDFTAETSPTVNTLEPDDTISLEAQLCNNTGSGSALSNFKVDLSLIQRAAVADSQLITESVPDGECHTVSFSKTYEEIVGFITEHRLSWDEFSEKVTAGDLSFRAEVTVSNDLQEHPITRLANYVVKQHVPVKPGSGIDTGTDSGTDTGTDSGTDTGTDSGTDTGTDSGTDAGTDSSTDTGTDSSTDTGTDSGTDTGVADTDIDVDSGATGGFYVAASSTSGCENALSTPPSLGFLCLLFAMMVCTRRIYS